MNSPASIFANCSECREIAAMPGSVYYDHEWFNFEGFAVVFYGERGSHVTIVPDGLFPAVLPVSHPENLLVLRVRASVGKFSGEAQAEMKVADLLELLSSVERWDADGVEGLCWESMPEASLELKQVAGTRRWDLHFHMSEEGNTLQGTFPLNRDCVASARSELAAIVRSIRAAEF